jgi:cbb3-type cytochrome c oxidase subunit III
MRVVQGTQAMTAQGKSLFAANCVGCHGDNGEGKIGIGPRINSTSFLAAASDGFLMRTISKGREGTTMIPWGAVLGEDGVKSVVAHMRSWDAVPPAELDERPLEGSVADGQQIFADICSSCHGRTGAGYQETANGTGIGRRAFLAAASNGYLRYLVKHGKDQTQMRGFSGAKTSVANLNDTQIENVIAYLRDSAW